MLLGGAVAMPICNAQGANSAIELVEDAVAIRANAELGEPRREQTFLDNTPLIVTAARSSRPPAISR
jgi:hypothetical protein